MTALDDFIAEHDRPLRLRRAADLLRPGHRGRGGAARAAARAGRRARPARERRGPARAARAGRAHPRSRRCSFEHGDLLRATQPARAGRPPATSTCSRARCSTSTTSRTRSGSAYLADAPRPTARCPRRSPCRPAQHLSTRRRGRSSTAAPRRRPVVDPASDTVPALTYTDDRPRPARPPRRRCLDVHPGRGACPATWSSAASAAAAARSSCGPTSRPTRSPSREVWVVDPFRAAHAGRRTADGGRRWPTCGPTSTRCARPSSASACSTTGSASSRASSRASSPRPSRSSSSRCCASAPGVGDDVGDRARRALRPKVVARRLRDRRRPTATRHASSPRSRPSGPSTASTTPLERIGWDAVMWRKAGDRGDARRRHRRRRAGAEPGPLAARHRAADHRPHRGGRLLQHAPRGGPHPALAVPAYQRGHRRPRLRGHRRRQRLGARPAARRGLRPQLRARVPLRRPRRRAPRPRPSLALNRGIAASRGRQRRPHDRRRPRAHARRPPLRHVGLAPTSPRWWPPSSGTSAPASRAT